VVLEEERAGAPHAELAVQSVERSRPGEGRERGSVRQQAVNARVDPRAEADDDPPRMRGERLLDRERGARGDVASEEEQAEDQDRARAPTHGEAFFAARWRRATRPFPHTALVMLESRVIIGD
jgi:hypothetical protein